MCTCMISCIRLALFVELLSYIQGCFFGCFRRSVVGWRSSGRRRRRRCCCRTECHNRFRSINFNFGCCYICPNQRKSPSQGIPCTIIRIVQLNDQYRIGRWVVNVRVSTFGIPLDRCFIFGKRIVDWFAC